MLTALSKAGAELSVLVVNKEAQQIPDTSENYGLLMAEALEMSLAYHLPAEARVVWDRHFSQWQKQERLANLVSLALSLSSSPADANSKSNTLVQLADFVAGAYHRKHRTGDATLAAIVASSVVEERIVR